MNDQKPPTDPSAIIIPFGKHKGATVAELIAKDQAYADWVMSQGWVAERFAELHAALVTRGAGTEDTPEHNALQARFLDADFRCGTLRCAIPRRLNLAKAENIQWAVNIAKDELKTCENSIRAWSSWRRNEVGAAQGINDDQARLPSLLAAVDTIANEATRLVTSATFEVRGVDVVIKWDIWIGKHKFSVGGSQTEIELKPSLGDDYPTVMRQMKRLGCPVCVVGQYTGRGASENQLRQMFEANGQTLIFVQEIEEHLHHGAQTPRTTP